jgi:hypothetical protein
MRSEREVASHSIELVCYAFKVVASENHVLTECTVTVIFVVPVRFTTIVWALPGDTSSG